MVGLNTPEILRPVIFCRPSLEGNSATHFSPTFK